MAKWLSAYLKNLSRLWLGTVVIRYRLPFCKQLCADEENLKEKILPLFVRGLLLQWGSRRDVVRHVARHRCNLFGISGILHFDRINTSSAAGDKHLKINNRKQAFVHKQLKTNIWKQLKTNIWQTTENTHLLTNNWKQTFENVSDHHYTRWRIARRRNQQICDNLSIKHLGGKQQEARFIAPPLSSYGGKQSAHLILFDESIAPEKELQIFLQAICVTPTQALPLREGARAGIGSDVGRCTRHVDMSVANNRGVFQTSFIELYHGGDFLQVCRTQHLEQPLINQPGPLNELKVVLRQFHVITIVIVFTLRNNSNNNCQLRRNGFEGKFKLQQRTCRLFCQREKHKCCIWMGWARGGSRTGRSSPPKTCESIFFTMNLYNPENSIRDTRAFCRPLFCHNSVVKYTSSLLQLWSCYEWIECQQ